MNKTNITIENNDKHQTEGKVDQKAKWIEVADGGHKANFMKSILLIGEVSQELAE